MIKRGALRLSGLFRGCIKFLRKLFVPRLTKLTPLDGFLLVMLLGFMVARTVVEAFWEGGQELTFRTALSPVAELLNKAAVWILEYGDALEALSVATFVFWLVWKLVTVQIPTYGQSVRTVMLQVFGFYFSVVTMSRANRISVKDLFRWGDKEIMADVSEALANLIILTFSYLAVIIIPLATCTYILTDIFSLEFAHPELLFFPVAILAISLRWLTFVEGRAPTQALVWCLSVFLFSWIIFNGLGKAYGYMYFATERIFTNPDWLPVYMQVINDYWPSFEPELVKMIWSVLDPGAFRLVGGGMPSELFILVIPLYCWPVAILGMLAIERFITRNLDGVSLASRCNSWHMIYETSMGNVKRLIGRDTVLNRIKALIANSGGESVRKDHLYWFTWTLNKKLCESIVQNGDRYKKITLVTLGRDLIDLRDPPLWLMQIRERGINLKIFETAHSNFPLFVGIEGEKVIVAAAPNESIEDIPPEVGFYSSDYLIVKDYDHLVERTLSGRAVELAWPQ